MELQSYYLVENNFLIQLFFLEFQYNLNLLEDLNYLIDFHLKSIPNFFFEDINPEDEIKDS